MYIMPYTPTLTNKFSQLVISKTEGTFSFQLVNRNNEYLITSVPFKTRLDCLLSMIELKGLSERTECFQEVSDSMGLHYFRIKNVHGKLMAISAIYQTGVSRDQHLQLTMEELRQVQLVEDQD